MHKLTEHCLGFVAQWEQTDRVCRRMLFIILKLTSEEHLMVQK